MVHSRLSSSATIVSTQTVIYAGEGLTCSKLGRMERTEALCGDFVLPDIR